MFDPAALGTTLIGLDAVSADDAAPTTRPPTARLTRRHPTESGRDGPILRRFGALLASLLPRRASYEEHELR
jgi:hypothetical protein